MTAEAADAANGATSSEQRQEWRRLALAATPGPWAAEISPSYITAPLATVCTDQFMGEADRAFIAAARTAVPALLDALEAAEADIAALAAACEATGHDYHDASAQVIALGAELDEANARAAAAEAEVAALREAGWLLPDNAERRWAVAYEVRNRIDGTERTVRYSARSEAGAREWAEQNGFHVEYQLVGPWVRVAGTGTAGTADAADHPTADPGDGRSRCPQCGKYVWPVTHSCKGVPPSAAGTTDAVPECSVYQPLVGPQCDQCGRPRDAHTHDYAVGASPFTPGEPTAVPPSGAASPDPLAGTPYTTAAEDNPAPRWAGLFGTDPGIVRSVSALAWCDVNGCRSRGRWYEVATRRHLCDDHVPPSPAAAQGEAGQA